MGLFLKWGNWSVAKLMEFLFNTTSLTDVGCTMRCIHRHALEDIQNDFTVDGSFFGPEMMLLSILRNQKVIQIPVNYSKRTGTSAVTGNKLVATALGLRMIALILDYRSRSLLGYTAKTKTTKVAATTTNQHAPTVHMRYENEHDQNRVSRTGNHGRRHERKSVKSWVSV